MAWTSWFARQLESPRLPRRLVLLALLLGAPGLTLGLQGDDYLHRAAILGVTDMPAVKRSPAKLFSFVTGDPATVHAMMDRGELPWWSDPNIRAALFRPVTGITHWLDYQLPPRFAWLMHLHSLGWFAAAVAVAAACYRRIIASAWTAGLAALLFTIDDARGIPAVWLANRNAHVGFVFGGLCLLAHDRWRRDGWRWGAALAPVALLLGLLGNEGAAAFGGYLLAYALFIDTGALTRRLASLLPCLVAGMAWLIGYRAGGYGTYASSVYIDPSAEPLRYLAAAAIRAPLLLWGQFAAPTSDLHLVLRPDLARVFAMMAVGFVVVLVLLFGPIVRRDRVARFWALGLVLALAPVCATFPSDRLLTFVGFGGMGLLAHFFSMLRRKREAASKAPRSWHRRLARLAAVPLLIVHLVIAPLNLLAAAPTFRAFGTATDRVMQSYPADEGMRGATALIVNSPSIFLSAFAPIYNGLEGRPIPARNVTLCASMNAVDIRRIDERTIAFRPEGGYLASPAGVRAYGRRPPPLDPSYVFVLLDHLFSDDARPLPLGAKIELTGLTITVSEVTPDGRPAEATAALAVPLDDPALRWLQWKDGKFEPFTPPEVGAMVTLPPARIPLPFGGGE